MVNFLCELAEDGRQAARVVRQAGEGKAAGKAGDDRGKACQHQAAAKWSAVEIGASAEVTSDAAARATTSANAECSMVAIKFGLSAKVGAPPWRRRVCHISMT
jgi:hypothetical protein